MEETKQENKDRKEIMDAYNKTLYAYERASVEYSLNPTQETEQRFIAARDQFMTIEYARSDNIKLLLHRIYHMSPGDQEKAIQEFFGEQDG